MRGVEQQRYFQLGRDYWWLRGKYLLLREMVDAYISTPLPAGARILDIGCGPGNLMDLWSEIGPVYGSDFSDDALVYARGRGYTRLFLADLTAFPVASDSFDLISMVDVLEHIEQDEVALREAVRVLRPGGHAVISVPAFQALWGAHDERYGHFRRYRVPRVRQMLLDAGLRVDKLTYFESAYFLPLLFFRNLKKVLGSSTAEADDFIAVPPALNRLLTWSIVAEGRAAQRVDIPFGVTIVAVAHKPAT